MLRAGTTLPDVTTQTGTMCRAQSPWQYDLVLAHSSCELCSSNFLLRRDLFGLCCRDREIDLRRTQDGHAEILYSQRNVTRFLRWDVQVIK